MLHIYYELVYMYIRNSPAMTHVRLLHVYDRVEIETLTLVLYIAVLVNV
jgi:hypothetical protein